MPQKSTTKLLVTAAVTGALLTATVPLAASSAVAADNSSRASIARVKSTPVFIVGDSLTVGAKPYLQAKLKSRVRKVTVDARVGRFSNEGISKLRGRQARQARVWVVALGTNDGPSSSATRSNVRKVLRKAGPRRQVIWVNVVRPGGYSRVNGALRRADAKYDNLTVIDWAKFIRQHRYYLGGDRVHLNSNGYRARGQVIAQQVRKVAAYA